MPEINETFYSEETPKEVIDTLESAKLTRSRVRLFFGDPKTGKDWLDEWNVTGTIGRSTGTVKIPLLISNSRSMGGPAIMTENVIRILINGVEKYRNPNYQTPTFILKRAKRTGYKAAVYINEKLYAQFKTSEQAERWINFMLGYRMAK